MPKPPPNVPALGNSCTMRGKGGKGTVIFISDRNWARVNWEDDADIRIAALPTICHLYELERL
jgi:hypothetical protein